MALPPNVTAKAFAEALKKFEAAVGKQWVFSSDDDVALYRDSYSVYYGEKEEYLASAAVAPDTTEQVQKIVQIANEYKIPLFPIATGKNLGYGGPAPSQTGSVVVDLKRMNRVLEIDDKRHFALLEPGVSYFEFYKAIQEKKANVWMDTPDPGWGSVVGNALDRGLGYTMPQFRDHFGAHCGMEVVTPTGEIMRTGMGALPGAKSWQDYRYGFGPYMDGIFSQGNFGIVTKMGFWLMPAPEAFLSGTVMVPRRQDIIPLIEVVNYLENAGMIGMPQLGSLGNLFGPPDPELGALLSAPTLATEAQLDEFARSKNRPNWTVTVPFYGPAKVIAAQWEWAKEKFAKAIPAAKFQDGQLLNLPVTPEQADGFGPQGPRKVALGIPNLEVFLIGARSPFNPKPTDGHAWFMPIIPRTGEALLEANRVFAEAIRKEDITPIIGAQPPIATPPTWIARSFIFGFGFPVSRSNEEQNQKMRATIKRLIKVATDHGWGEYRAPVAFQDITMDQYSFNNHALRRFAESLKDAADPNGIIAPGRYGIWPKHLRNQKKA